MTKRINSIDYLRGALALAVMFYHYVSWGLGSQNAETLLGRLGIYSVASFYIVSGISLYLVYSTTNWSSSAILDFSKKRALRIYPLYIFAILLMLIVSKPQADIGIILGNLFIVFGFYAPNTHIPVGGWSVGNEVVFYTLFPLLLILMRNAFGLAFLIFGATFLHTYFAFAIITPDQSISSQTTHYMNPLNQLLFFVGGLLIGKFGVPDGSSRRNSLAILLLGSVLFLFWPATGDRVELITGWTRIAMTAACLFVCWSVFCSNWDIGGRIGKVLKTVGDISYSTYLLHGPIAIYALDKLYPKLAFLHWQYGKLLFLMLVCGPLVIIAGYISFHKFESPLMRLGQRRLTLRAK